MFKTIFSTALLSAISFSAFADSLQTGAVDTIAAGKTGNKLGVCHVVGPVTEWQHSVRILADVTGDKLGEVDAGLLQFGPGSWLEGCSLVQFRAPSNNLLDLTAEGTPPITRESGYTGGIYLEGVLANYVIADGHSLNDGAFDKVEASHSAGLLLRDYYHLKELNGFALGLVDGVKTSALGSSSFQFGILLIKNPNGSFDAVVQRQTLGTKFAPVLDDAGREASIVQWSSIKLQ